MNKKYSSHQQQFNQKKRHQRQIGRSPTGLRHFSSSALAALTVISTAINTAHGQGGQSLTLEEIVITAQKREQSALTVPITVDTFTAGDIQESGAISINDMDAYIPGFEAGNGVTQNSPRIRGIQTSNISVAGDPSVATFYDDVYLPQAASTITFADMARVDVLKGPQGTLFGRNAAAGVVSLTPNSPGEGNAGYVSARLGNYSLQRIEAMVNAPLLSNVYFRGNILSNRRDSVYDDKGAVSTEPYEQKNLAARLAVLWQINDKTKLQLSYDYDDVDNGPRPALGFGPFSNFQNPTNHTFENDVVDARETRDMDAWTAKFWYDINDKLSLKYVGSYRDWDTFNLQDEDGTADRSVYFDTNNEEDSDIFYNELQFSFTTDRIDAVFGVTYTEEDVYQRTTLAGSAELLARNITLGLTQTPGSPLFGAPIDNIWDPDDWGLVCLALGCPGTQADAEYDLLAGIAADPRIFGPSFRGNFLREFMENEGEFTSLGFYGDIDFTVTDRLNIIAGLRYSRDEKDFSWNAPANSFADIRGPVAVIDPATGPTGDFVNIGIVFLDQQTPGVLAAADDWEQVTGRLVANYQVADEAILFASFSTGFKSGGFDSLDPDTRLQPFEPEEVENYELGVKGKFFQGRLQTQLSAFLMEITNRQQGVFSRRPGALAATYAVINTDEEVLGTELTVDWLISDTVRTGLIYTYRDSEATRESYYNSAGVFLDSDNRNDSTPQEYTVSFDWTPEIPVGSLVVHFDYIFLENIDRDREEYRAVFDNVPGYGNDTESLNARILWLDDSGRYEIAIWGRNLLDNDVVFQPEGLGGDTLGLYHTRLEDPVTYGVDLKYNFY